MYQDPKEGRVHSSGEWFIEKVTADLGLASKNVWWEPCRAGLCIDRHHLHFIWFLEPYSICGSQDTHRIGMVKEWATQYWLLWAKRESDKGNKTQQNRGIININWKIASDTPPPSGPMSTALPPTHYLQVSKSSAFHPRGIWAQRGQGTAYMCSMVVGIKVLEAITISLASLYLQCQKSQIKPCSSGTASQ